LKDRIPVKLLLVENHHDYALLLRDKLLLEVGSVDVAFSPEEAISKADTAVYDVCITGERLRDLGDYHDQSGIELVKTLSRRTKALRFIVNSDFPSYENVRELLSPANNLRVINYISNKEGVEPILESIRELYQFQAVVKPDAHLIHPVGQSIITVNNKLADYFRDDPEALRKVDPFMFERIVAELFEAEGYKIILTPPRADGGKDIYAYKTDQFTKTQFLVECKRYTPPSKVDVKIVRELYGVVQQERASGGIVVTTSYFTKPAITFANTVPYQLFLRDIDYISQWLRKRDNSI
jgi:restriction endonuclease Mrr